jgi:hypothetical protein
LIKTERDRYVTLFFHPYFNQPAQWHRLVLNAFPAGLFQATEATALEEKLKLLLSIRDQSLEAALRNQQRMTTEQEEAQKSIWGNILHRNIGLSMPAYAEILRHAVYTQTIINQARIACALERHRLEKGSYPDSLEELQGLAGSAALLDAASGKPMRYRRVEGRKYALWSIGLDGVDHGGKRGEGDKASKKAYVEGDDFVGDWVWDFPGK